MGTPNSVIDGLLYVAINCNNFEPAHELRYDERIVTERCFSLTDPHLSNVCRTSQFHFKLNSLPPILLLETLMNTTSLREERSFTVVRLCIYSDV